MRRCIRARKGASAGKQPCKVMVHFGKASAQPCTYTKERAAGRM